MQFEATSGFSNIGNMSQLFPTKISFKAGLRSRRFLGGVGFLTTLEVGFFIRLLVL